MQRIARGGHEIKMLIKSPCSFDLRVHGERADAGNIGRVHGAHHRIFEQSRADAVALPAHLYYPARDQHDWDGVVRETFRLARQSTLEAHLTDYLISSSAGTDHDRRGRTRVNERASETGRLLPRQSKVTRDGWVHCTAKTQRLRQPSISSTDLAIPGP